MEDASILLRIVVPVLRIVACVPNAPLVVTEFVILQKERQLVTAPLIVDLVASMAFVEKTRTKPLSIAPKTVQSS
jgi:hypothetical protein